MLNHTPTKLLADGHATAWADLATLGEVDVVAFLHRYRWTILASILVAVIVAVVYVQQTTVL